MVNGSSIEPYSEDKIVDTLLYPFFGDVPTWVIVTGVAVGLVVGLVLGSIGVFHAIQQYRHESYHRDTIRVVETASTLVANVGFWLLIAPFTGFVVALFSYVLWPHSLWIAPVLVGLGALYYRHTRP